MAKLIVEMESDKHYVQIFVENDEGKHQIGLVQSITMQAHVPHVNPRVYIEFPSAASMSAASPDLQQKYETYKQLLASCGPAVKVV